jgi:hypothetical protein
MIAMSSYQSVAECEMEKSAMLEITPRVAPTLLPVLFAISAAVPSTDPDDLEPHISAAGAMHAVVGCAPEQSAPVLIAPVQEAAGEVLNLIADDATVAADFVQFPKFPHAGLAMVRLRGACVSGNLRLSDAAFSALQNAAGNVSRAILHRLLAALSDLLAAAVEDPAADFRIFHEFHRLLQNVLVRLAGQIPDRVERLWRLTTQMFERYPGEAESILLPLPAPAASTSRRSSRRRRSSFSGVIGRWIGRRQSRGRCDSFDLSPFAPVRLEALTAAMAEPAVPIQAKGFVAAAIGDLARTAAEPFLAAAGAVLPPIAAVVDALGDVVEAVDPDEDEVAIERIIIACAECLREARAAPGDTRRRLPKRSSGCSSPSAAFRRTARRSSRKRSPSWRS